MIFRSQTAKVVSFILATGIVAGASMFSLPEAGIEMAGSGPEQQARMGAQFEDMVVGSLTAEPAEELLEEPVEPEVVEPVQPEMVEPLETSHETEAAKPVEPDASEPVPLTEALPVPLAEAPPAAEPQILTPATEPLEAVEPQEQTETLVAQEPETAAPLQSARPKARDPEQIKKAQQKPEPKVARKPAKKTPKGNAKRNNTKGATRGEQKTAEATQTGQRKAQANQSGNAAASNYPGKVMRRIARAGKPRVGARGTAVIAFSVTARGTLAAVSVARSSGSAALDQAAVRLIRKAAPFPPPPAGARRQFSIRIKGK
ncbi:MAG: energy transducer TonB [Rhodobacteraceae bacterium]|nr:energy transducer TonB [Paracoccaceae bacterium]